MEDGFKNSTTLKDIRSITGENISKPKNELNRLMANPQIMKLLRNRMGGQSQRPTPIPTPGQTTIPASVIRRHGKGHNKTPPAPPVASQQPSARPSTPPPAPPVASQQTINQALNISDISTEPEQPLSNAQIIEPPVTQNAEVHDVATHATEMATTTTIKTVESPSIAKQETSPIQEGQANSTEQNQISSHIANRFKDFQPKKRKLTPTNDKSDEPKPKKSKGKLSLKDIKVDLAIAKNNKETGVLPNTASKSQTAKDKLGENNSQARQPDSKKPKKVDLNDPTTPLYKRLVQSKNYIAIKANNSLRKQWNKLTKQLGISPKVTPPPSKEDLDPSNRKPSKTAPLTPPIPFTNHPNNSEELPDEWVATSGKSSEPEIDEDGMEMPGYTAPLPPSSIGGVTLGDSSTDDLGEEEGIYHTLESPEPEIDEDGMEMPGYTAPPPIDSNKRDYKELFNNGVQNYSDNYSVETPPTAQENKPPVPPKPAHPSNQPPIPPKPTDSPSNIADITLTDSHSLQKSNPQTPPQTPSVKNLIKEFEEIERKI